MDRYNILGTIGDGSYSYLMKAELKETGELVAIKKMKRKFYTWEECMNLREIRALRKLYNKNIVQLKELIRMKDEFFFVFEYIEKNLFEICQETRDSNKQLEEQQIRSYIYQIACGLAYMHKQGFFHRDLKLENVLVQEGEIKLGSFGLSREIRSKSSYLTDYVSTRWYRAPEVLLKANNYGPAIDIFALGCIMAELYLLAPLFPGSSEIDQINKICFIIGTPTNQQWPEGQKLASSLGFQFPNYPGTQFQQIMPNACYEATQLIQDMLKWDPNRRPTPQQILQHQYFTGFMFIEYKAQQQLNTSQSIISQRKVTKDDIQQDNRSKNKNTTHFLPQLKSNTNDFQQDKIDKKNNNNQSSFFKKNTGNYNTNNEASNDYDKNQYPKASNKKLNLIPNNQKIKQKEDKNDSQF